MKTTDIFQKSSFQKIFFLPPKSGVFIKTQGVFLKNLIFQSIETRIHLNDPTSIIYGSLMVRRYNHSTEKNLFMIDEGTQPITQPQTEP